MTQDDPFRWKADGGYGLVVPPSSEQSIAHEVLYEDDITHIKDQPVFLGAAIPRVRFIAVLVCIGLLSGGLITRAFWMQVVQGADYRAQAERNRLRHEVIPARRGIIIDRGGRILAENMPSFEIRSIAGLLPPDQNDRDEVLAKVGRLVGMTVDDMRDVFASSSDPNDTVVLKRDVPYDRAIAVSILAANTPGIQVAVGSKRLYPSSAQIESLSHVLGYVGGITKNELANHAADGYRQTDLIGKTGVESTYESTLRGTPGERVFEVDSMNRVTAIVGERTPVDGKDVPLTIDLDLQAVAEKSLQENLTKANARRGAVIAMDPRDGSILALVSWPSYDDNFFSGTVSSTAYQELIKNPDHPLLPRAWAGTYPSGSTVKPVIALAALSEGVITPKTTVLSTGGIQLGPWFFPDWKAGGHGVVNVRSAIAWSVNTFFYTIGGGHDAFVGLGVDRLAKWFRVFGLGKKTGIDLPGEGSGFVPSQAWKKQTKGEPWYIGDTYNLSIGQGDLLVTPLQVAAYTAAIANGGYRVTPHVSALTGTATPSPDQLADPKYIETVRLGMRDTVVYGSGRALSVVPIPISGKTGTAQWGTDKPNHAWFTSFAPYDNPEIVVTVLLEEGVEGSSTAVPVAKDVYTAWLAKRAKQPGKK